MMTCFHENKVIFANIKHIVELPKLNYPLVNFIERTIFYQEIPQNFLLQKPPLSPAQNRRADAA